jgi:hypothetical protein
MSNNLYLSSIGIKPEDKEVIPALKCENIKNIQMYTETVSGYKDCELILQVSPVDDKDLWFTVHKHNNMAMSDIIKICAKRLRVMQNSHSDKYELNLHIVGQI